MKTFACVLLVAAAASAEPSWFRQNYRFARQESEQEPTTARTDDAEGPVPYPAAGFRPDIEFKLPTQQAPVTTYGLPDSSYGPPAAEYGPPEAPTTEAPEVTTPALEVEGLTNEKLEEEPQAAEASTEVVSNQGAYYILLPTSQVQRVQFQTENDLANMAYTARLQYKNEDRAPLYVYTTIPQHQTSASILQVSGALVQPTAAYQPSATYLPASAYITPSGALVQPW